MHKLTFLIALAGLLLLPATAFAQDELDCDDFTSQTEAQAVYDADSSDPNNLDGDNDGQACEGFDYGTGGSGSATSSGSGQDELDCDDFTSQTEAQAVYDADPGDPNNLDGDNDGQACEGFDYDIGGAGSDIRTPTRIETGGGGTADTDQSLFALAFVGLAALAFAVLPLRQHPSD